MTKYLIHERKAGAQTDKVLDRVPIYADDYAEASEKFTDWVMDWMSQDNSESAIQETVELRDYVDAHGNLDSYSFDGVRYWFQEVPGEEEPDPLNSALERIAQDENISPAFRDGLRGLSL